MPKDSENLYATLDLSPERGARSYAVTFIRAGRVRARDGQPADWFIPAETLQELDRSNLLNARAVFIDHPQDSLFSAGYPSLRDLVGVTGGAHWNPDTQSIDGFIRLYDTTPNQWASALLDQVLADQAAGLDTPDVGLSLVFFGNHSYQEEGEKPIRITDHITHVESCDLVFGPAAEGRVRQALSTSTSKGGYSMPATRHPTPQEYLDYQASLQDPSGPDADTARAQEDESAAGADLANQVSALSARMDTFTQLLAARLEPDTVQGMGQAPSDMVSPGSLGQGGGHISGMNDPRDQVEEAFSQLMGLPVSGPVHRLSGIREFYLTLTGDRDLTGRMQPDQLAVFNPSGNVGSTSTMAEIVRNVLNKVLVHQVDLLQEYRWWERIAHVEDFATLQQVSWIRTGGIGDIPTVAEAADYTQLDWDDARITAEWVKKGGYLPLTLETIDRDDTAAWKAVPRHLATAAEVTLSGIVSALFTDNSGVGPSITTEGSTAYAFSSTFGNLINQPLDYTNWGTVVETMYKQAQYNVSGRRQGLRPKFLLVPIELEAQGIAAVTSDRRPGTDYNDRVPTKRMLPESNVITVPDWTDADNWAALADPALCPFVGVGFRYGRTPELFTASDPQTLTLFMNDVLPIKVRWFFAVSVIDPRGAIKSNNP